ncbi:hypothetical protein [Mesorhizobium sp. 113-3-3]|uniref:hypothetical protein n=1 Tax=Mesorhizobium sp. 113-3-3 TaxID=2744516 RepID=UPI0019270E03|nr:hypothetical protein [Mesorhizobium sp. 113-3-3]
MSSFVVMKPKDLVPRPGAQLGAGDRLVKPDPRENQFEQLVGFLAVDGIKSLTLRREGSRMMMTARQDFLDGID